MHNEQTEAPACLARVLINLIMFLMVLKHSINDKNEYYILQRQYLLEAKRILEKISQDDYECAALRHYIESGQEKTELELAIMGPLAKDKDLPPHTLELACIVMGLLIKICPISRWPDDNMKRCITFMSIKTYEVGVNYEYHAILSILLLGRTILGDMLSSKLGIKHLDTQATTWLDCNDKLIDDTKISLIYSIDDTLMIRLRNAIDDNNNPHMKYKKEDILFKSILPFILFTTDVFYTTKHEHTRIVAIDCIFTFVSLLDTWYNVFTAMPSTSSKIANALYGKHIAKSDCIVGSIHILELMICKCLNDKIIGNVDNLDKTVGNKLHLYIEKSFCLYKTVSKLEYQNDDNVKVAMCDFLGSIFATCSMTFEIIFNDIFSILMPLVNDPNPYVSNASKLNLKKLSTVNAAESSISKHFTSGIDNLSLLNELNQLTNTINSLHGFIHILPTYSLSIHFDIFLESLINCIIRISNMKLLSFTCFPIKPIHSDHKLLKSVSSIIKSLTFANFSYSYKLIKCISNFLNHTLSTNESLTSSTWVLYCILDSFSPSVNFDYNPHILFVMDLIYPLITQLKVSKLITGNYSCITDISPQNTVTTTPSAAIVNSLNCLGVAFKLLKPSVLKSLTHKWLYVLLTKIDFSQDEICLSAENALISLASSLEPSIELPISVDMLISSNSNYLLNASISMLFQPDVDVEAFYLLVSVIKCKGTSHLKNVDCIVNELINALSSSWSTNNELFDRLIAIIDLLSQKILETDFTHTKLKGLTWNKDNTLLGKVPVLISTKSKPNYNVTSLYGVPLSLLHSSSPEFQSFFLSHAKNTPVTDAQHNSDLYPTPKLKPAPETICYHATAMKILPVLHRYAGSYKSHIRKSVINATTRLLALFTDSPDSILPEIHKKWLPIVNRLSDESFDVILAAANAILVMCQLDPSFVKSKVNKDVFPHIIRTLDHFSTLYLKKTTNDDPPLRKTINIYNVAGASQTSGKLASFLLSFASEIIALNVIPDQEHARKLTMHAINFLNSTNYVVDLSLYSADLLTSILLLKDSSASDFAWLFSWLSVNASQCSPQKGTLCPINLSDPRLKLFLNSHNYHISPDIEYRSKLIQILLKKSRSAQDIPNITSMLANKQKFVLVDNYTNWNFNVK